MADKFKPPPRGPNESNYDYASRKSDARLRYDKEQRKTGNQNAGKQDKRKATGDDRTAAQKAADQGGRGTGPRSGQKKATVRVTYGPGLFGPSAGQAKPRRQFHMTNCSKCGATGQESYGFLGLKLRRCRRCGGTGQANEEIK